MNAHEFAVEATRREGMKQSISIAQMKEAIRVIGDIMLERTDGELYRIVNIVNDYFILPAKRRAKPKPARKLTKSESRRLAIMRKGKKKEVRK